jgi:CxxC motif-containing protein (DUF1111 family)
VFGKLPEVHVDINYNDKAITYPDGSIAVLRDPVYTITQSYISLPAGYMLSPRMAPPVFGAGLLELIPESTVLSFADENDKDGDGISGKPNYVHNPYTQTNRIRKVWFKSKQRKYSCAGCGCI